MTSPRWIACLGCVALFVGGRAAAQTFEPASPHPPVRGFFAEQDWLTIEDFRHVSSAAAGDVDAYAGTTGGVVVLEGLDARVRGTVTAGDGLPTSIVTALAYDESNGRVWVGTPLGLAIYEPFRGQVRQDPLGLGPVAVGDVRFARAGESSAFESTPRSSERPGRRDAIESQGYVLAGGRWYRVDPFTLSAQPVPAGAVPAGGSARREFAAASPPEVVRAEVSGDRESFRVTTAVPLFDGSYLLGTWGGGTHLYEPARMSSRALVFGLAGSGGGAMAWDGEQLWFTNSPARRPGSAPSTHVDERSIITGRAGAWAGDVREGIASAPADLTRWSHHYPGLEPGLVSDRVYDVAFSSGRPVLATDAGLLLGDGSHRRWRRLPLPGGADQEVLAVEAAPNGLWVGTRRGLHALRRAAPPPEGEAASDSVALSGTWLTERAILSLAADGRDLYVGTDLGLYRLAAGPSGEAVADLERVPTLGREIRDLALLPSEALAATERGLEIFSRAGGEGAEILVGEDRLHDPPLALAADSSNVWIGTASGVARWDRGRGSWTEYGLEDGLPALPVLDVLVQDARHVWFSTPRGATRFEHGGGPR